MTMHHATQTPASPADPANPQAQPRSPFGLNPNGSPNPGPSRAPKARGWSTKAKVLVGAAALAVLAVGGFGAAAFFGNGFGKGHADLVLHTVKFGSLPLTVV